MNLAHHIDASRVIDAVMPIASVLPVFAMDRWNTGIAGELVGIDRGLWQHVFADHAEKCGTFHVFTDACHNAALSLDHADDGNLGLVANHRSASTFFASPAVIRLVDLDRPADGCIFTEQCSDL